MFTNKRRQLPGTTTLTEAACHKIADTISTIGSWTPYSNNGTVVTWKPLFCQLVAQFSRPPSVFVVESMTTAC